MKKMLVVAAVVSVMLAVGSIGLANDCRNYTEDDLNSRYAMIIDQDINDSIGVCEDSLVPEAYLLNLLKQAWMADEMGRRLSKYPKGAKLCSDRAFQIKVLVGSAEPSISSAFSQYEGVPIGKSVRFKMWKDTKIKWEKYYKSHPKYKLMLDASCQ